MMLAIAFLVSVVFGSINLTRRVSSQIAVPQFSLVLVSAFLMEQQTAQIAALLVLFSIALGAIGVWHRLVYGPDPQNFHQHGMGRFLIGGLGCVIFSAAFLVMGLILTIWQILATIGGAWQYDETRMPWKERWLLTGTFFATSMICIPAIFNFRWREQLSQFGD